MKLQRSLSTVALVFVMFFNTSGGPFSTETLVAGVGPGLALLIMLVVPIVWSLPETLIVAELASMLPLEGGYYRWVDRAFGRFWAFQNGWWTWMYSLVDMALYPTLLLQYLKYFVTLSPRAGWLVELLVIWVACGLNLRGALRVGRASIVAGGFVLITFLALSLVALTHATHIAWVPFAKPGAGALGGIGVGLSIALWNYIGWDNASTVQGEVRDASRSYPRALAIALPLVALNYLVPLIATLSATDWRTWSEGSWPQIAAAAGGAAGLALAALVAIAGMVSALALFNALLLVYSRIPLTMADDGLLPAALARVDVRGTPKTAIIVSALCYSVLVLPSFGKLVVADVLLYSMALFLEFGALIALRRREPTLRGAYRIPLSTRGVTALALLPASVLVVVVSLEIRDGEYGAPAVIGALVVAALGPPLYKLAEWKMKRAARLTSRS